MKKIAVFWGLLVGAVAPNITYATTSSLAATLAVPLNQNSTCVISINDESITDFEVECRFPANAQNVTATVVVDGIGMCASDEGPSALDSLTHHYGSDTWCWCKMYNPWVSKWVQAPIGFSDEASCFANCAKNCADFLANSSDTSLRGAMFNGLMNFVAY